MNECWPSWTDVHGYMTTSSEGDFIPHSLYPWASNKIMNERPLRIHSGISLRCGIFAGTSGACARLNGGCFSQVKKISLDTSL